MRPLLAIALSAPLLAGCSTYYDKAAVPEANAAWEQASESCKARAAALDIKTHSERAACDLAADRAYYEAVKLKAMYKFDDYAASYQKLAVLRDTNQISDEQADNKANQYLHRFYSLCNCGSAQSKFGPVPAGIDNNSVQNSPAPPTSPPFP